MMNLTTAAQDTTKVKPDKFTAPPPKPDTVKIGIYINSVFNIEFKQEEYSVNVWIWLKYKRKEFDVAQNQEIPMAKTMEKTFATVDTTGGRVFMAMKLQCVMRDSWKIGNFPF